MRTTILSILAGAMALFAAAPRRVALVVQNHTPNAPAIPLAAVADTLNAKLSGPALRVINPHNAIGVDQNRTAQGEVMPKASAQEIGRLLNAEGVLVAAVQEYKAEDIGVPPVAHTLKVRLALNLLDAATGEVICGVSGVLSSGNYTAEQVKASADSLFENLLHDAAAKCAEELLAKVERSPWRPVPVGALTVFIGCNVLGADVQIDGLSYGTCPAQIAVTPGVHLLTVSCPPFYRKFERRALFKADGQAYAVVLALSPEGEAQRLRALEYQKMLRALKRAEREADFDFEQRKARLKREQSERCELFRKQMALADAMLKRYERSGAADDYVRKTIAEGVAVYWKNSHGRIVITDGKTEKIDFTTPVTHTGPLTVPPRPEEIAGGLQKLLMQGVSQ